MQTSPDADHADLHHALAKLRLGVSQIGWACRHRTCRRCRKVRVLHRPPSRRSIDYFDSLCMYAMSGKYASLIDFSIQSYVNPFTVHRASSALKLPTAERRSKTPPAKGPVPQKVNTRFRSMGQPREGAPGAAAAT